MNVIETERLILRTWKTEDVDAYHRINQDSKVLEFLPGSLSREQARAFIALENQQFAELGYTLWAVEEKASGKLLGFIGLNQLKWEAPFSLAVEIGWRLGSEFWRKGYAFEGAEAALKYGFNKCGLKEIISFAVPANIRSIRVMEKIGMQRDLSGDFHHPRLPLAHPLSLHVLYRIRAKTKAHHITFKALSEHELALLHRWFQKPQIREWYTRGENFTFQTVVEKYLPRIADKKISSFIIYIDDSPIGYVQFYQVAVFLPEGVSDYKHPIFNQYQPEELAGLDMFIAEEEYLGKGHASEALRYFISIQLQGKFRALLVDPLKQNKQALRFFERNGFRSTGPGNDSLHELMILRLDPDSDKNGRA